MPLSSSSGTSREAARQEGWELELLPGSFGAGLWLASGVVQKRMFSVCLSRQRFWPMFLFLDYTSRNHRAGRALALLSL